MSVLSGIRLHDVVGNPAGACGILFVPALFDFEEGMEGRPEHPLAEHPGAAPLLNLPVNDWMDPDSLLTLWAEARIRAVFRAPGSLLHRAEGLWSGTAGRCGVPFVAVTRFSDVLRPGLVPFVFDAGPWPPALRFRRDVEADDRRRVASAFYAILMQDPTDLVPFEASYYDENDDYEGWVRWGYGRGEFYFCDLSDWAGDDVFWEYQSCHRTLSPDPYPCPDCGGSGEESFFPAGEVCETCAGKGELIG